jgi:hypothetical protein
MTEEVAHVGGAGPEVTLVVHSSLTPPVGQFGPPSDAAREEFGALWKRGSPVSLDHPAHSSLVAECRATLGEDVVDAFETTELRVRGGLDPVAGLVWAGADAGARVPAVVDVVEAVGLAASSTVYRRIDSLEDLGLIRTVPGRSSGSGRSAETLQRAVDADSDAASVQAALCG